ncbi:MAG: type II toxin-antitoxin system prevent-host-death family antitoxin [Thiohalocapsa sp.]
MNIATSRAHFDIRAAVPTSLPRAAAQDRERMATMRSFSIEYAANHLKELLDLVEQGESVVLSQDGRPVARLVHFVEDGGAEVPPSEVEEAFHGD